MQLIETPQMAALRAAVEETLAGLQAQANGLRWQVASLQAQNRLLAGHASDLLEMVQRLEAQLGREAA